MSALLLTALAAATPNKVRRSLDLPDFEAKAGARWKVAVEMPDGTPLHTVVALPKGDGPWPVVFLRSPYPPQNTVDSGDGGCVG